MGTRGINVTTGITTVKNFQYRNMDRCFYHLYAHLLLDTHAPFLELLSTCTQYALGQKEIKGWAGSTMMNSSG